MIRLALATFATLMLATSASAAGWGSVKGQFILDGDVPEAVPLITKGDAKVKDAAVCAVENVPDDALAFDPETKGIGNIIVFLRRAPANIHPDLKESKEKEILFDQENCRFIPHCLVVRTDQTVRCVSSDDVQHNVRTNSLAGNTQYNLMVSPNDKTGALIKVPKPEPFPVSVNCDIHPWMNAFWVVVDHPYAAVTGTDGSFTIENLPVGDHELAVWHEKVGWIDRRYKVSVKADTTVDLEPVKVALDKFKK